MKVCTKCKVEKEISSYYKKLNVKGVNVGESYCKECCKRNAKIHASKKYYSLKDGKYHVYLLPEEHYCGQSNQIDRRLYCHDNENNKIIQGYEIFGSYDTRDEAKLVEAQFHALGWFGRAPYDKKFCLNSWQYEN